MQAKKLFPKIKLWIAIYFIYLFSGCYLETQLDPSYSQIPKLGLSSIRDISQWIAARTTYKDDGEIQYVQSPLETYQLQTGDCEDYAVFMMYLIHQELGGEPFLITGMRLDVCHAWVKYNGRYYEAQGGDDVTSNTKYVPEAEWDYYTTMYHAEVMHRTLTK